MTVDASVEETTLLNDDGHELKAVQVTCSRCAHVTQSFGTSATSIRRCLALLREECPGKEKNYYIADNYNDGE